jgi:hypothetical protein
MPDPIAARVKAERLLREHLTEEQQDTLDTHGWFDVLRADRTYRIHRGRFGNIDVLVGTEIVESLCVHPVEDVPDADTMLAQKLYLEADEPALLQLANRQVWQRVTTRPQPQAAAPPMTRTQLIDHALQSDRGRTALAAAVLGALRHGVRVRGAASETVEGLSGSALVGRLEIAERLLPYVEGASREIRVVTRWARFVRRQLETTPRAA